MSPYDPTQDPRYLDDSLVPAEDDETPEVRRTRLERELLVTEAVLEAMDTDGWSWVMKMVESRAQEQFQILRAAKDLALINRAQGRLDNLEWMAQLRELHLSDAARCRAELASLDALSEGDEQ